MNPKLPQVLHSIIGVRTIALCLALALLPVLALWLILYWQVRLTPASGQPGSKLTAFLGVTALAAAAALALGAGYGASLVSRIAQLLQGARRLSMQDFSHHVPVSGADELSQLAQAFNDMAQRVGSKVAVHGILTQMDDAILTKLDLSALIRSALLALHHVNQAQVVLLGLFESGSTDFMRVFFMHAGERGRIGSEKLTVRAELKRRILLNPTAETVPASPFPEEFESRLRAGSDVTQFFIVPLTLGDSAWGVMVSCHAAQTQISSEQRRLLGAIAKRLIAGFSASERDQKLHSLAYVDPLTGLPNRAAMQSLLTRELDKARRSQALAAILFVDLDRFKQANDTHGHALGDRLLAQAAHRIRSSVREDDALARIGGDEFAVILTSVKSPREAASVARKLIQALSRRFEIDGHTVYTGASVGIAIYPHDSSDGPELVKMADTAMYRAKGGGRSRYAFYEEPMNAESKRRSVLDDELRNALQRQELVLHYQPQIDLRTGALCGVEALVRWQHPTRGLLYPADFIDYAEEIGLIPEIGAWVMLAACHQYQLWREQGVRVPRVSVNVSNGQLPRSNFLASVQQLIATTGIPPAALELEVTESLLVQGGKAAMEALNQLARDGVLIAIDDFGTGYSSFSYLKTMPAQVLKMDMSFLVDARADNDAGKIVAAIINMAHALQKEVVAEGIERIDQLKLLKSLGCERGQGYLFGKGVPAEKIARTYGKLTEPYLSPGPAADTLAPTPAMVAGGASTADTPAPMELP